MLTSPFTWKHIPLWNQQQQQLDIIQFTSNKFKNAKKEIGKFFKLLFQTQILG